MTAPRVPPMTIRKAVGWTSEPMCPPSSTWPSRIARSPTRRPTILILSMRERALSAVIRIHSGRDATGFARTRQRAGNPRTQTRNRLTMQLAYARFRHAEHFADLAQVQVLFVIEAHHHLLALRQILDRLHERLAHRLVFELFERIALGA